MSLPPSDLTEALGVTPFFHLIPKQELTPLLSFSRVDPAAIEPKNYLSNASQALATRVQCALNEGPGLFSAAIENLVETFSNFEDEDSEEIKFKKPVIAGNSERDGDLDDLPALQNLLYRSISPVKDLDLIEFEANLDVSDITKDHLEILPSLDDKELVRSHNEYYEKKFDIECGFLTENGKKLCSPSPDPLLLRKRVKVDENELAESTISRIYLIIGKLNEDSQDVMHEVSQINEKALHELYQSVSRLSSSAKVADLEKDSLLKIQRLCLQTFSNAEEKIEGSESYMKVAMNCALASKTILLIMNADANDKRLHVETYVDKIVSFITTLVLERIISKGGNLRNVGNSLVTNLVLSISETLALLSSHLEVANANEHVLTQLEYMCIEVIFAEVSNKNIDDLCPAVILLLVRIFKSYDSQRQFIVHEVLSNFKRLPHQKSVARQLRLSRGANVLFFTVLILNLIQSFDAVSMKRELENFHTLTKSNNPHSATNLKRNSLLNEISGIYEESKSTADSVARFFLDKLGSADVNYKSVFQLFLDDILSLVSVMEWPGADTIANSLLSTFLNAFQSNSLQGTIEPYALDVIGKIGHRILELRLLNPTILTFHAALTSPEISEIGSYFSDTLQYLQLRSLTPEESQEFNYSLLKSLASLGNLNYSLNSDTATGIIFAIESETRPSISEAGMNLLKIIDNLFLVSILGRIQLNQYSYVDEEAKFTESYLRTILALSLASQYEAFLNLLVKSLESTKVKVATKAIRLLSSLIDIDTDILLIPAVNVSVSKLLVSNSPLSRDAVIDLMGKYIFSDPALADQYYKPICDRSGDVSILVRKRVLKLMKSMYIQTDKVSAKAHIAIKLLRRLDDEEQHLAELAKNSLFELWLLNIQDFGPTKCTSEAMMEVVSSSSNNANLLKRFISDFALLEKDERILAALKQINDYTFDKAIECVDTEYQSDAERALHLVSVLIEHEAGLIKQDQLISLQPYLVDNENSRTSVCFYALKVLKTVLPNFKALRKDYISKTHTSLLQRLTKFDVRELHQAMPALKILCDMMDDKTKLASASISCMRLLKPHINELEARNSKEMAKISKLLHLLGCFGAYCEWEDIRRPFLDSKVGLKSNESVVSLISKFLLYFCKPKINYSIRIVAVKNIVHVCTHHPKLFLSKSIMGVIDSEFEGNSNEIKTTIIEGFIRFLTKEDEDALKRNGAQTKSSQMLILDVAEFHGDSQLYVNDGVCASITQRYMEKVLEMCLYDSGDVSLIPVHFLQLVMKLGYANPKVCISTIIALESSPNKCIKRIATELHTDVFEKHETLADRNYMEAIRMAVRYCKLVIGNNFLKEMLFLRSVYRVVGGSYSSKKKFMLSVAKLFRLDFSSESLQECMDQRDVIVFLSLNLLVLNFSSMEEVCLLLYHLDRSISHEGIDLSEKITSTIGSKSGSGMSVNNLQLLFVHSQSALALIYLRQTLASAYSVSPTLMETFRPSKADVELRQQPRAVTLLDYPLEDLALETNLAQPGTFGQVFTRMVVSIKDFTNNRS